MNIYYVYMYLRANDSEIASAGTPYYIGKGKDRRAWSKHAVSLPANPTDIVILSENLSEVDAFELEKKLISQWGRVDLGTGILRNRTHGGDGSSGAIRTDQHKQIISEVQRNRVREPQTPEHIKKRADSNRGKKRSEEFCKLMKEINKGIKRGPLSDEIKEKISKSLSGKKKPPRSAEHALKIKQALSGKKLTPEQRANRKTPKRKPMSAETKAKIGAANKGKLVGRHRSPESIRKQLETRSKNHLPPTASSNASNCR